MSIAAINGYAMGGGLECALACDLRIAEEHAVMGLPEASVGLLPCGGGTQWLAWTVGESWAKRMMLLGERVDAATGSRSAWSTRWCRAARAWRERSRWLEAVAKQSPSAVRACKRLDQRRAQRKPAADADSRARGVRRAVRHRGPARGRGRVPGQACPALAQSLTRRRRWTTQFYSTRCARPRGTRSGGRR